MYQVEWVDPQSGELETDQFVSSNDAMEFATARPLWWLLDGNRKMLANGERDSYQWKNRPCDVPPWW